MPIEEKGKLFVVKCDISSLSYDKGFHYMACGKCKKKVLDNHCLNCGEDAGVKATYKVNMNITDGTGSLWIAVFGEAGEQLIGKPADELRLLRESGDDSYKKFFESLKMNVIFPKQFFF